MANQDTTNKYFLAIVGIVAVVGIFILVLNASNVSFVSDENYVGEATGTCDSDRICEQGESKSCRDCRWIYCNINDVCEGQEDARCTDCHFAAGWYCDHDGVCESTGYPREPTTGECDDCP